MIIDAMEKRHSGERGRDYAYRVLRHNIITSQLPPATILNEAEISEMLNMSRTPIREALILLREERLVNIVPQRGSRVSLISMHQASEGYFMRLTLESKMLKDLAGNLSVEQCIRIKKNIELQEEVLQNQKDEISHEFLILDSMMHRMLYEFTGRMHIYESVTKVCSHYDRIRYLNTMVVGKDEEPQLLEQHRTFYYYLTLGIPVSEDSDKFYEQHLGRWQKDAQKVISAFPAYFTD